MTDPGTAVDVKTRPSDPLLEDGDHDRYAHYVPKDWIVEATITGTAVIALCGKVWVPNRAPDRFPVCPECKDIHDGLGDDQ